MRIAVPVAAGRMALHFGHCESFALVDVDPTAATIVDRRDVPAPPHQPGLLPPWLAGQGVDVIIAGGMGQRAQDLFAAQRIRVLVGASAGSPEELVTGFLKGTLALGANVCDH
ncbi:MAG: NifB/NifX family molybdenum-iron cluster-binding protein [Candidatus Krumholzibacteriia bacterium]